MIALALLAALADPGEPIRGFPEHPPVPPPVVSEVVQVDPDQTFLLRRVEPEETTLWMEYRSLGSEPWAHPTPYRVRWDVRPLEDGWIELSYDGLGGGQHRVNEFGQSKTETRGYSAFGFLAPLVIGLPAEPVRIGDTWQPDPPGYGAVAWATAVERLNGRLAIRVEIVADVDGAQLTVWLDLANSRVLKTEGWIRIHRDDFNAEVYSVMKLVSP